MARDSSGNYTLPTGNPVAADTTIEASWANTTLGDIADELTDSLSRSGKGSMSGVLKISNGSAASPALQFGSDSNTGLYRVGADNLGLGVGGALKLDINSSRVNFTNRATIIELQVPNLTDSEVSLAVGAGSGVHLELGGNDLQAKSDATTATSLDLNPLGGNVNLGPQSGTGNMVAYADGSIVLSATASALNLRDGSGSEPTFNLQDDAGTSLGQLRYSSGLQLKSVVHGAAITLRGEDNSGTEQFVFNADPDAGAAVYYAGLLSTRTINSGLEIHSTVDDTPTLSLYQDDNTTRNALVQAGLTALTITNEVHGAPITLRSEDTGGTSRVLFTGDPDGSSGLYESGVIAVKTETTGASIRHSSTDDPQLDLASNAGTVLGRVLHAGGSGLTLRSVEHGTSVFLQGEDSGGVLRDMVTADPDGAVTLEHDGTDSLRTAATSSAGSGAEVFDGTNWHSVGYLTSPIQTISASTDLRLANVGNTFYADTASIAVDMDTTTDSAPNGSMWKLVNISGGDIDITATGVTLNWNDGAGGTTGARTLADGSTATIQKYANGEYYIEGNGLT